MDQITDSPAAPPGGRAGSGGRPRQTEAGSADAATGPSAAQTAGPDPAAPPSGRKPRGGAFADVMQGDAAGVSSTAAPHADRGKAQSQLTPGTAGPAPKLPAAADAAAPSGRAAPPASSHGPARPGAPAPAAHGATPQQQVRAAPVAPAESGQAEALTDTAAVASPQRTRPTPIQRVLPAIAGSLPPGLRESVPPSGGKPTTPTEVKAAAREFAAQMTRGAARMTPDAPMQNIAAVRPAPPPVTAGAAAPGAESLADAATEPQPTVLGGERQGLLITPVRVAAAGAAALPMHHQPPAPTPAAPDAILAQISTQLSTYGRSEMTLRLDPPELGLVRIGLTMGEGQVTAVITADRADIDGMLRRHAAQLSAALEDAGYHGVDLSFGERGEDMGDDGSQPPAAPAAFVQLAAGEGQSPAEPGAIWLGGDGLDLRL